MADWMPLGHQVFLTMHEADGTPKVNANSLNIALAAAVLTELALQEQIHVSGDRFWPMTAITPPTDPLTLSTLQSLIAVQESKNLSHWIRVMSSSIYDKVSGGLLAAGAVTRDTGRRTARYRQTTTAAAGCQGSVRVALTSQHVPHPAVLALAGFYMVLRQESAFGFNRPAGEVYEWLKQLLSASRPEVQDIIFQAERLVGSAALSAYR